MRVFIKRRPPKAKAPPLSLNSIRSLQPPPKSKPTTASATTIARRLRMVLGSGGAMIWWRHCSPHGGREGKAALVGWDTAHLVGCPVCVCVCVFFFFFGPVSYLSGRKSIQPKLKWPIFAASFQKICAQRQPISMLGAHRHSLMMCAPFLLVGEMLVLIDLSGRKKCTKILLGRVPSYFFFRSYRDFY